MKNSICEKLVWLGLSPTIFKFIKKNHKDIDINALKKKSKKNYREMIARTPDIGSMSKNSLRIPLAGGMLWLSIFDAMKGKMASEDFKKMVDATLQAPLLKLSFQSQNVFSLKAQKRSLERSKAANSASNSEFNWNTEFIPGRDKDEYITVYHQCGLCALGRQEHHEDLIPYMCDMDYSSVKLMGGVLKRTGTLADGADRCDFYICKKGSKWDIRE